MKTENISEAEKFLKQNQDIEEFDLLLPDMNGVLRENEFNAIIFSAYITKAYIYQFQSLDWMLQVKQWKKPDLA